MKNLTAALISLGCDKNTVDSERMLGMLANAGIAFTGDLAQADIIIINTCGFLQDAVNESKEEVAHAIEFKRAGTCKALVVTGCAATRYRDEFLQNPDVDVVLGVNEYDQFSARISDVLGLESPDSPASLSVPRVTSTPRHYAYLRIAEGCDKHCTYCTIPSIRGAYTSVPMDYLVAEATLLAENGAKELVLVAQDTSLYGADIYNEQRLHVLLQKLSKIPGIKWLRVLYCYPEHIYSELLAEMAQNDKILQYLDLPIQHSSDKILKLMNRRSTEVQIRENIAKIRNIMPDAVLRTTLITGFPGENKKDFQALCDFVEEIKFNNLGVFAYSREEGTPADKLDDHLQEKTKQDRSNHLMAIQQRVSANKLAQCDGHVYEVVVDGTDENGIYYGRSYMHAPDIDGVIFINSESELEIGEFVQVRIVETWEYDMLGEVVHESAE